MKVNDSSRHGYDHSYNDVENASSLSFRSLSAGNDVSRRVKFGDPFSKRSNPF
ncbi:MAG: hypothetical protein WD448_09190 [Woeseia sp.]